MPDVAAPRTSLLPIHRVSSLLPVVDANRTFASSTALSPSNGEPVMLRRTRAADCSTSEPVGSPCFSCVRSDAWANGMPRLSYGRGSAGFRGTPVCETGTTVMLAGGTKLGPRQGLPTSGFVSAISWTSGCSKPSIPSERGEHGREGVDLVALHQAVALDPGREAVAERDVLVDLRGRGPCREEGDSDESDAAGSPPAGRFRLHGLLALQKLIRRPPVSTRPVSEYVAKKLSVWGGCVTSRSRNTM